MYCSFSDMDLNEIPPEGDTHTGFRCEANLLSNQSNIMKWAEFPFTQVRVALNNFRKLNSLSR